MQRSHIVRPAAMFWGLVVFMPVGVTYLSAILLLLTLVVAGDGRERLARLRANPLWWPVMAYLAWTLLVLAFGRHYPETPSNLFHGIRIGLTILMAMALTREEALWALRGFLLAAALGVLLVVAYYAIGFPLWSPLRAVVMEVGNKSISNALLFSVVASTAAVWGIAQIAAHRPLRAIPAFVLMLGLGLVVALPLTSRTSVLALLLVVPVVCIHQWRSHLKMLVGALVLGTVVLGAGLYQLPQLQHKVETGVQEIEDAQNGAVFHGSWIIRYYMYRDTGRMIADRPLTGWGIGGWTEQWHKRGPALFADSNMPHNDFLWVGSQGGLPALLSLLLIMVTAVWQAWKRPDIAGRYALAATLIALIASSVNSALRDAQIGLALLWIAMIYLRLAQEKNDPNPWRGLLPSRRVESLTQPG
ncbi:O-antigen ligase family protein [Variovorax sp. J22G73]|uniref:O-antigen ligase family protein n=1 Tax=unclassified Variovorax TaxID=663243 RepID=UPI000E32D127|nr:MULTISPECIES: O-antigen ligase family protein [unclassified Variovorax]MDM0007537.1 O-antigen ligase family protein [Variovorax sp. J22R203]MDM0100103.1 O-antigen ligase family protein [Variovorax sp. J22G73]